MRVLDKFILKIPYLFLKKIPYAWLAVVYFWIWPPVLSSLFLAIVLLGLGMMVWQNQAWINRIRREFSGGKKELYLDRAHAGRIFQLRNLALVLAASAVLGWLLNHRLTLSGLQWALLLAGFMLLYRDAYLFGPAVTYIVTDQGIGIRYVPGHVDYRLFFKFREIRQATPTKVPKRIPRGWQMLAAQRHPQEGILLTAMKHSGFSKEIPGEILVVPTDSQKFLQALAGHVAVMQAVPGSPEEETFIGEAGD
jgi:hypothetical protein